MVPQDRNWIVKHVCPNGFLDFWAVDFDIGTPRHVFMNVLSECKPKIIFVENSGRYSFRNGNDEWDKFNSYMLEDARAGRGDYVLWIDSQESHLALVEQYPGDGDEPYEPRLHSVYVRRSSLS